MDSEKQRAAEWRAVREATRELEVATQRLHVAWGTFNTADTRSIMDAKRELDLARERVLEATRRLGRAQEAMRAQEGGIEQ